jgi:hypothetical protein
MFAAMNGETGAAKLLLERKADIEAKTQVRGLTLELLLSFFFCFHLF